MFVEEYIQLLYEIERELDDDECEDRWEEAIRRANEKCKKCQRYARAEHQKYSPLPQLKPQTRRRKRVH